MTPSHLSIIRATHTSFQSCRNSIQKLEACSRAHTSGKVNKATEFASAKHQYKRDVPIANRTARSHALISFNYNIAFQTCLI